MNVQKLLETASQYHSVLEVGCGNGGILRRITSPVRVGIDIWEPYIKEGIKQSNGERLIVGDVLQLDELAKEQFDFVFGMDIVEHLTKNDGFRLIILAEKKATKGTAWFIPVGWHPQCEKDNNPFQTHQSEWHLEDMLDLGYEVWYYPDWHLQSTIPNKRAMWCVKEKGKSCPAIHYQLRFVNGLTQ